MLFIVNGLMDGPLGFNELSRRASGVNATTLSQRMDLLEKHGIVEKTVFSTIPPRTNYKLTGERQRSQECDRCYLKMGGSVHREIIPTCDTPNHPFAVQST